MPLSNSCIITKPHRHLHQPEPDFANPTKWADTGVVLHQPLNRHIFRKNSDFLENMNGIPVSPSRFLQNAPTWRSPNPFFGTPFWGIFWSNFRPLCCFSPVNTTPQNLSSCILFIYLFNLHSLNKIINNRCILK